MTFAPATVINANVKPNPNPNPNPSPNLNPYPTPNQKPNHYPHSKLFVARNIMAGATVAGATVGSPYTEHASP